MKVNKKLGNKCTKFMEHNKTFGARRFGDIMGFFK